MQNAHPGGCASGKHSEQGQASLYTPPPPAATHRRPGRKTDRRNPTRSSPLDEPLIVAQFKKNRSGHIVRISIENYEGRVLVHVREYFANRDGNLCPTRKGIALAVLRLPDLAAALNKAAAKASELGLIGGEP